MQCKVIGACKVKWRFCERYKLRSEYIMYEWETFDATEWTPMKWELSLHWSLGAGPMADCAKPSSGGFTEPETTKASRHLYSFFYGVPACVLK